MVRQAVEQERDSMAATLARSVMSHASPMAGPQFEIPVPPTPMPSPYFAGLPLWLNRNAPLSSSM